MPSEPWTRSKSLIIRIQLLPDKIANSDSSLSNPIRRPSYNFGRDSIFPDTGEYFQPRSLFALAWLATAPLILVLAHKMVADFVDD